jgi:F-type H+-transporting ATPase subunit gamma
MTALAAIQRRIASMDELLEIVGAMRSLAGMRVQEAQRALPGIRRYADSMATAVRAAVLLMPQAPPQRAGRGASSRLLILCSAEHGFVGGFNERLLDSAEAALAPADVLFVLGSRGAALAAERGWRSAWTAPMPTRLAGAPDTVNRLTTEIYKRIVAAEVSRVEVLFGRVPEGTASPTIEHVRLLPLDTARLAARQAEAPLHNLQPGLLLERLAAEYLFALLTEAAVESIASENAARFIAMNSARENVTRKLDQLQESGRQERQTEITSELLDLITGTEAQGTDAGPL